MKLREIECPKCHTIFHSAVCPFCGHRVQKKLPTSFMVVTTICIIILPVFFKVVLQ